METDMLEPQTVVVKKPETVVNDKTVDNTPQTVDEKEQETVVVDKPAVNVRVQPEAMVDKPENSEHKKPAITSVKKAVTLPSLAIANGKVSVPEGGQLKKPAAKKKESDTDHRLTVELGQSAPTKSPLVQTGSPSGSTDEHILKSALPNWNVKTNLGGGWQCTQGGHQLTYDGQSIKGSTGSAAEVKGMFEVARANNWKSMAFDGNDAFKSKVIETALKSGYAITTFNDKDLAIVNAVVKKMEESKRLAETKSNENPALNAARTNGRAVDLSTQSRDADVYRKSAAQAAVTQQTKTALKSRQVSLP